MTYPRYHTVSCPREIVPYETVVPMQGFGEPLARTDPLGLASRNPATEVKEDPATLLIDSEEKAQLF